MITDIVVFGFVFVLLLEISYRKVNIFSTLNLVWLCFDLLEYTVVD